MSETEMWTPVCVLEAEMRMRPCMSETEMWTLVCVLEAEMRIQA